MQSFAFSSVAQAVLVISLITALGLALGNVKVLGFSLGIAGVLFIGLFFGHFKIAINEHILEFAREFGLILFVYTIGLQVGPGFFSSLRKEGLPLNIMAAAIVLLGVFMTLMFAAVGHIDLPAAVGLFSGATTNTPSLAAAQQALKDVSWLTEEARKLPGMGYAVAYPFGIMGIIFTMLLVRRFFKVDVKKELESFTSLKKSAANVSTVNLEVQNSNIAGLPVRQIPSIKESNVVISRYMHDGVIDVVQADTRLAVGDVILVVGAPENLEKMRLIIGKLSDKDLRTAPSELTTRRVIVTKKDVLGKTIADLDLARQFDVIVTRVGRSEVQFTAHADLQLKFADTLLLVGEPAAIQKASDFLGNSTKELNHPQAIPVFVGIALGVLLGSIPIHLPGMPAPVKLGLAGGPLIVALILSRIGRVGPLVWYMPISANFMLRELGISLFLACVGLKAGDKFFEILFQGPGFYWMACAALITLVPLLIVALVARAVYKVNYVSLCGLLAGSMTDPPALAFANAMAGSDAPSISYATVYPLTMLLRVLCAQAMVLLFMR